MCNIAEQSATLNAPGVIYPGILLQALILKELLFLARESSYSSSSYFLFRFFAFYKFKTGMHITLSCCTIFTIYFSFYCSYALLIFLALSPRLSYFFLSSYYSSSLSYPRIIYPTRPLLCCCWDANWCWFSM